MGGRIKAIFKIDEFVDELLVDPTEYESGCMANSYVFISKSCYMPVSKQRSSSSCISIKCLWDILVANGVNSQSICLFIISCTHTGQGLRKYFHCNGNQPNLL